jgi:hypothetical protein
MSISIQGSGPIPTRATAQRCPAHCVQVETPGVVTPNSVEVATNMVPLGLRNPTEHRAIPPAHASSGLISPEFGFAHGCRWPPHGGIAYEELSRRGWHGAVFDQGEVNARHVAADEDCSRTPGPAAQRGPLSPRLGTRSRLERAWDLLKQTNSTLLTPVVSSSVRYPFVAR